jgi:hypothetical protein
MKTQIPTIATDFSQLLNTLASQQFSNYPQTYFVDQPPIPTIEINSAFIERCRRELTYFIGPIAHAIVEETLNTSAPNSPEKLVDLLTEQIPNLTDAYQFRERLL